MCPVLILIVAPLPFQACLNPSSTGSKPIRYKYTQLLGSTTEALVAAFTISGCLHAFTVFCAQCGMQCVAKKHCVWSVLPSRIVFGVCFGSRWNGSNHEACLEGCMPSCTLPLRMDIFTGSAHTFYRISALDKSDVLDELLEFRPATIITACDVSTTGRTGPHSPSLAVGPVPVAAHAWVGDGR
jgi:hypothetical protein